MTNKNRCLTTGRYRSSSVTPIQLTPKPRKNQLSNDYWEEIENYEESTEISQVEKELWSELDENGWQVAL